jgi:haloalkane dehalogenase
MEIKRTPDERFANLPGWDFTPLYLTVDDEDGTPLRIHYIEEGPRDADPILLIHGNPTWSYLHRKMIPVLVDAGHRVIAVDLVGCGRSDKPAAKADYTLERHYAWMSQWLLAMDLTNVTLFCQDWGGTIGLYLVSMYPERFARVMCSNTGLPTGTGESDFMKMWVGMMRAAVDFPWPMLQQGMGVELSAGELAAYRAPFPDNTYESGIISFPGLITVQPDNPGTPINQEAWARLANFDKPLLTVFGDLDPVAKGFDKRLQKHVPGAAGQAHAVLAQANHFIQEDAPGALCDHLLGLIASNP